MKTIFTLVDIDRRFLSLHIVVKWVMVIAAQPVNDTCFVLLGQQHPNHNHKKIYLA